MQVHSLSSFTTFLRRVLSLNLPQSVWVTAEIGQINESRGHHYLSLIEKDTDNQGVVAQMDAVLWRSQRSKLIQEHGPGILSILKAGVAVKLKVTAELHDRFGLKLIIEGADPEHTLGQLQLEKQAILARLVQEKLVGANAQIPLPGVIQRLAVISSETAAGYADFQEQLQQNKAGYTFTTELFASAMQGDAAATQMIKSLQKIERRKAYFDAIVMVRGGGAKLDLLAFDDERLCRQIAQSGLPVLTGIGHETDEVLADRVAHLALKTPTAVATYLLERSAIFETRIMDLGQAILRSSYERTEGMLRHLDRADHQLVTSTRQQLNRQQERLRRVAERLPELSQQIIAGEQSRIEHYEALLAALEPQTILSRGYAILSQAGKILHKTSDVDAALPVEARLAKDRLRLRLDKKEESLD